MPDPSTAKTLLIVEDNDDDFEATEHALRKVERFENPIYRCKSGHDAMEFLTSTGKFDTPNGKPTPCVILLDLNLPGMDGRDVLERIKANPELRLIPVVVMTSSYDQRDVTRCYESGANSYIVKPLNWDCFFDTIARFKKFWLETALLPGVK